MTKYLAKASYTQSGVQGLLKDGGSKRRAVVESLAASLGGKLETLYYAFGEADLYCIVDMPDRVNAAAMSLMITAAGGANVSLTVLLTPEEIDEVVKKAGAYSAPGQ